MKLNPYKNTLTKVKALLKEDDQLTKEQCELFQWQLLVKIPGDFSFNVGKGGVNTIFYTASSEERAICYPEEMVTLLEKLAAGEVFCYQAYDKNKAPVGYSIDIASAKKFKGAKFVAAINFKGKRKMLEKKVVDLFGKKTWQKV